MNYNQKIMENIKTLFNAPISHSSSDNLCFVVRLNKGRHPFSKKIQVRTSTSYKEKDERFYNVIQVFGEGIFYTGSYGATPESIFKKISTAIKDYQKTVSSDWLEVTDIMSFRDVVKLNL